jgi:hypothetical protein
VTLACPCGKRLGLLEVRSDLPDIAPEVLHGVYFHGRNGGTLHESPIAGDRRQIPCERCGEVWSGPVRHITELVQGALAQGAGRVTL